MKLSLNPDTSVQRHFSPLFKRSFFSLSASLSKISEPPSQNQQNDKHSVDYHLSPSRLASRIHPFNISVNYLGLYLSIMLVEFTLHVPSLLRNIFTHALFPYLKFLSKFLSSPSRREKLYIPPGSVFLKNCFPQQHKGVGKLWSALSKFIQKIWISLGTLGYLHFVWFAIFSNVMALQLCK